MIVYSLLKSNWPLRDSNTQPSDLESDALPLRQGVLSLIVLVLHFYSMQFKQLD